MGHVLLTQYTYSMPSRARNLTFRGLAYGSILRSLRSNFRIVLSKPESRKIFYFLVLNMAYMLVQMAYGIWTNSLGLISDAIHMAFDCMAITVGLFASIMATWAPDERFTYGYGRIETLSGFANGIFLILISIFIVFEATQRLLEPPEMDTGQLLLVSVMGLVINLFGMFAMGGHHHHHHHHHHENGPSHAPNEELLHVHEGSPKNPTSPLPLDVHLRHTCTVREECHSTACTRDQGIPLHDPSSNCKGGHEGKGDEADASPLTPNYLFGHDDHFHTYHKTDRIPNLHDHSHTHHQPHAGHSHNMRGVFLHVMADTLGSVGVIISTLLIQLFGWTGFDPIASLFIAVLIAMSVIPLVVDTGRILALDVGARERSIRRALVELSPVEGLLSRTEVRFWPKDSSSLIGSIHIHLGLANPEVPGSSIKGAQQWRKTDHAIRHVDSLLRGHIPGLEELTIQIEQDPHII